MVALESSRRSTMIAFVVVVVRSVRSLSKEGMMEKDNEFVQSRFLSCSTMLDGPMAEK